jgi:TorA maturation chaperone TorD
VLLYPDAESLVKLPPVAKRLLVESRPFAELAFWGAWERLLASLQGWDGTDQAGLEAAYVGTFVVASDGVPCLPYESAYLPREATGWVLAELDREYARAGFSVAPSSKEPPDHAAVELEFMSVLCAQEAEAWRRRSLGEALERLEREAAFLQQHLGRWLPELARRVAERDGGTFYVLATDAARTFTAHDLELVWALLARYREVARR